MKLLMVEDQALFRTGLRRLLQAELQDCQVTEVSTAQAALDALSSDTFDLMTTDLSLPDYDGLWLIHRLRQERSALPILVLTLHKRPQTVARALQIGASGYLLKSADSEQLLKAVESMLSGDPFIDERVSPRENPDLPSLNLTSIEILNHHRAGMQPALIQEALKISKPTYESAARSLCRKLQADGMDQAVKQAVGLGLLIGENHDEE